MPQYSLHTVVAMRPDLGLPCAVEVEGHSGAADNVVRGSGTTLLKQRFRMELAGEERERPKAQRTAVAAPRQAGLGYPVTQAV
jgi:hypothetical protein